MSFWVIVAIWVIVLAIALGVSAIINLRAHDPRTTGVRVVSVVVVLALMTVAFAVAGFWGAGVILVLAICAQAIQLVRRRRRAT
jgi:hypothetical protein